MDPLHGHWYDLNNTRAYPLDDRATAMGTSGVRLPSNILVDLNLRYPRSLGNYPFLASVGVTTGLVSVTLQCAATLGDDSALRPLAVLTLPRKSVIAGRQYPLVAQAAGVGGWIVFGDGINEPYSSRFVGPAAGLLSPRAARPYQALPVADLAKLYHGTPMDGIIRLSGSDPLQVVKGQREIEGVLRDVAIVQLVPPAGNTVATTQNVFEDYAGPCGHRPESHNCGDWSPIEYLDSVQPDCDGNITIHFMGCAVIGSVGNTGVVVDCSLNLSDACVQKALPDENGVLPNEYTDQCHPVEAVSESVSQIPTTPPISGALASESLSSSVIGMLPYSQTFDSGAAPFWFTISGQFSFVSDDSPLETVLPNVSYSTESTIGAANKNLSLWEGFDHTTLRRHYTTDLKLMPGPLNAKHNAGLVVNYRPGPNFDGRYVYFLVEVSYDDKQFRIWYFNGTTNVLTSAFVDVPAIALSRWYRLQVRTQPVSGNTVNLLVDLTSLEGAALDVSLSLETNSFYPDTGWVGFLADRSYARFSHLRVKEVP